MHRPESGEWDRTITTVGRGGRENVFKLQWPVWSFIHKYPRPGTLKLFGDSPATSSVKALLQKEAPESAPQSTTHLGDLRSKTVLDLAVGAITQAFRTRGIMTYHPTKSKKK